MAVVLACRLISYFVCVVVRLLKIILMCVLHTGNCLWSGVWGFQALAQVYRGGAWREQTLLWLWESATSWGPAESWVWCAGRTIIEESLWCIIQSQELAIDYPIHCFKYKNLCVVLCLYHVPCMNIWQSDFDNNYLVGVNEDKMIANILHANCYLYNCTLIPENALNWHLSHVLDSCLAWWVFRPLTEWYHCAWLQCLHDGLDPHEIGVL